MPILESLIDLPYRVTGRHLLIAGVTAVILSPLTTPFTCRVGAKLKEPSIVPIDMELGSRLNGPYFMIRLPGDRASAEPDSVARIIIEECPSSISDSARTVWQITERRDRDAWLRASPSSRLFDRNPWYALIYGDVPEGWDERRPARSIRDGVPYVIRLDLDGRFGGRAFFIRDGKQLRYGPFYASRTTAESCGWFADPNGVWRRG